MSELSLGFEILGSVVAISALNVGVIMVYINHLHKQTEKDFDGIRSCINDKFNAGKKEHERLDARIDNEVSK